MGEYLVEQILRDVQETRSPVTGAKFPKLSKDYRSKKQEDGAGTEPNLENSGDMLDALDYRVTKDGLKIGVFGNQAPKADGHNNLSGESKLPERRFLPAEGEGFRPAIREGIADIIAEVLAEETEPPEELREVETKTQLFSLLSDTFAGLSRSEVRTAVLLSPKWLAALKRYDLLKWLE